jgi:hypothetical protein
MNKQNGKICCCLSLRIGFYPKTATPELNLSAFRSPSTHIKIHKTSAADPSLNVWNQQSGTFFVACPCKLASGQEQQLQS